MATRAFTSFAVRFVATAVLALLAFAQVAPAQAGGESTVDRDRLNGVLAGYLLAISNNITWHPATGEQDFRIGVVKDDKMSTTLERVSRGKAIAGRTIRVQRGDAVTELAECDVVFMNDPDQVQLDKALEDTAGKGCLVVSFSRSGEARGAGIDLVLTEDFKVRYHLSIDRIGRAGLVASPGLLKLALKERAAPEGKDGSP